MKNTEFTDIALGMYVGEPCRICGLLLTVIDVKDGAVFAGYSKDNKSRAAHKICWDNAVEVVGAAKDAEIARLTFGTPITCDMVDRAIDIDKMRYNLAAANAEITELNVKAADYKDALESISQGDTVARCKKIANDVLNLYA